VKQQEAPAQNSNSAQTDEVFTDVEVQAEFPGGIRALAKWLSANIRYPEAARLRNSQGRSFVKFIVDTDGSIQNVQVIKSSGDADLDKEAVRLVSNMPLWVPGKKGNKPVRTYFTLPVNFRLPPTASNNAKSGNYINGHEFVDLGLSVKWATCNVGANAPHETGGSYAWGETEEKSSYSWNTYKWQQYKRNYTFCLSKYCTSASFGAVDNKKVLEAADDVASVKWGGKWRMPTFEEQQELWERCKWTRMAQNGVDGYQITGPNGKSIFLPNGYYWSSALMLNSNGAAYDLDVKFKSCRNELRFKALLVRPVCS
jgi:TonB family protein